MRRRPRAARPFLVVFAELLALCGLAVAQPILDVFGRAPDVFVRAGAGRADIWWFAAIVALAPPVGLLAVEVAIAATAGERTRARAHLAIVATLGIAIAVRSIRLALGWEGVALAAAAVAVGVAVAVLHARRPWFGQWLVFASFAPLVFAALFLFGSSASSLAGSGGSETATPVVIATDTAMRPPVVLLVLDELPLVSLLDADGDLDRERFPGFASLADDSTWFRNTTTVATHTADAVPAILTGQLPGAESVAPVAAAHPDNLFRLLGNAYRFNVSELDTQLCAVPRCDHAHPDNAASVAVASADPSAGSEVVSTAAGDGASGRSGSPLRVLLGRARDEFGAMVALHDVDSLPQVEAERLTAASTTVPPATSTTAAVPVAVGSATPTTVARPIEKLPTVQPGRFATWLGELDADVEHPALDVLHITVPHNPWHLDASGTEYGFPEGALQLAGSVRGNWSTDPGPSFAARQRHLLQVRYVDTLVTALRARLVELGTWDETLVVVTADHGAGFDPGGWVREWDPSNETNLLGVPLFVHGPGFEDGRVDDRPVQNIDIVPTIADVARIAVPWPLDGVSLRALPSTPRTSHLLGATKHSAYVRVEVDVADHLAVLLAAAAGAPSHGGDDLTILRSGPRGELIGASVDEHRGDGSPGSVRIEYPADGLAGGSPARDAEGIVEAYVVGDVAEVGAGRTVVAALDGTIAATASTWSEPGHPARFALLLPPSWLVDGEHAVSYWLVDDAGRLTPLELG